MDAAQRATAVMFALMFLQWVTQMMVTSYIKNLETRSRTAASSAADPTHEAISLERE